MFGNYEIYNYGALENIKLRDEFYPEWTCRFYIYNCVPESTKKDIENSKNTEVIRINKTGSLSESTTKRFLPMSESDVEVMISRDCDSRLNNREAKAVEEWLNSNKGVHIMRDHPYHKALILGGMFGVKNGIITNIEELLNQFNNSEIKTNDQNFLSKVIYPKIKNNCLIHDEFSGKTPFPTSRVNYHFVGEKFDKNNNRFNHYKKLINGSL